ncbi:MAG: transglycosylase domain-containing protein [Flavobacteriales bacterium]|nr:transglycosylase domain-containing protein [Flavobacteriales bacterium]
MKKIAIKILKVLLFTFLIFLIIYQLLLSDLNPMFKRDDFIAIKEEINKSKKEDFKKLLSIYHKLYNSKSIKYIILNNSKLGLPKEDCPCLDVARYYGANNSINFKIPFIKALFTLKLEKEFSQDDCLKLLLMKSDFLYGNIGIKEASKYFFNKELELLNERELIELVIMLENPILYDPIRNREIRRNKILFLEKFLQKEN